LIQEIILLMKLKNYYKILNIKKIFFLFFLILLNFSNIAYSEILKKIIVDGSQRISEETIKIFSSTRIGDEINQNTLNQILKDIYSSGFFEKVELNFNNNILTIKVLENPIIQNITYDGVKSKELLGDITKNLNLKERSPYNDVLLMSDKTKIVNSLKQFGYYFSEVEVLKDTLEDNKVDLNFKIVLGDKAKINKISFIGDKVFKDSKLKSIIISEEYKFWKFISGRKYLNENIISLDNRMLKNYYLNKGYYNVKINSSFARMINEDNFELIFNIDAGKKIYFNELKLHLPDNFDISNFRNLEILFKKIKSEPYSLYRIEKILDQIDLITLNEEYNSINATLNEEVVDDKINISFNIEKSDDFYVEKINIFGNSVTRENVIRNRFFLDEGDPYSEILMNKTINELKSLNFFKTVNSEVISGNNEKSKIVNISVEEKPTGEISASAGLGTTENSIGFGVKENNFLGKGISLNSNLTLATDSIKGLLSIKNPNIYNTDKSVSFTLEASELDKFADFGYKTTRTGASISTNFELLDDFNLGLGNSNYYQNIETDSTASANQQKQKGDYFDSYLKLDFDFDKRNQKFQTTSGYRSFYSIDLPVISDTYSLINSYNYQYFTELYEDNITTFSIYLNSVNSLSGEDVKLSERLYIPSKNLRGFKYGSVGPKDGNDFIGGNFISTINFSSTIPKLLENSQNTDFSIFLDAANVWGVDYDSSIDDSSKIRSSIGLALDWFSPIGPMNFSLTQPITKANTDETESFRFNLGTTF